MGSVASGAAVHGFASAGSGAALFMGEKTALWKPGLVFTFLTWEAFEAISDARIRAPCFSQELIGWGFRVCRGSSGPARWANVTSAVCVCGVGQRGRDEWKHGSRQACPCSSSVEIETCYSGIKPQASAPRYLDHCHGEQRSPAFSAPGTGALMRIQRPMA